MSDTEPVRREVQTNIPPGVTCAPFSPQALDDYVRVALPIIRRILAKRGSPVRPSEVPISPAGGSVSR